MFKRVNSRCASAYAPNGAAVWYTRTGGNPAAVTTLQDDGNLVIYTPEGKPVWDSGTWGH